jgi:hypothetical protein
VLENHSVELETQDEEFFCRLLEEEWKELFRLFPESSIFNLEFPRGENLLLLQHSALGVPTWHLCLVSSVMTLILSKHQVL